MINLKKMLIGACMGMASGAGLTAYLMMNKKTKRNADKLLNNMMDEANQMLEKNN